MNLSFERQIQFVNKFFYFALYQKRLDFLIKQFNIDLKRKKIFVMQTKIRFIFEIKFQMLMTFVIKNFNFCCREDDDFVSFFLKNKAILLEFRFSD